MMPLFCLNCSKKAAEAPTTANEIRAEHAVDTESGARADKLAAHPEDPSKPKEIAGVSDDQLAASAHLDEAATACIEAIEKNPEEPRYRFELGRVLMLGGLKDEGRAQLQEAASMGHAAACFYLAVLTDDATKANELFEKASSGGFKPARDVLAEVANVPKDREPEGGAESAPGQLQEQHICRLEWHALGVITATPADQRDSVAAEVEAIMNSDQKVLYCSYADDKGLHGYNFWFEKTPANLSKITERVPKHPLLPLGFKAISKPPATIEEAAAFLQTSGEAAK